MALFAELPSAQPLAALVAAVFAIWYGWSAFADRQKKQRYGCSDPPKYPHRDPLGYDLFSARESATVQGEPSAFDRSLFAAHGQTFEALRWGTWRQKMIWTCEPSNIQTIAALSFDHFEFRTLRQSFGPFMGNGLLTTDGPEWAHSREMVRPVFRRSRIGDFGVFEVHVKRFLDLLPTDGSTVDVQPLFKRLFLDSATEFFMGQSMDSLLPSGNSDAEEFLAAFDESLRGMARTTWLGRFGWIVQWDSKLREAQNKVYRFIDGYVDEAIRRANGELGPSKVQERGDYVLIDEMAKECKDRLRLRHEVINIFLPARDTTGIALGLVLYNLARAPDVLEKLRAQVLEKIPKGTHITFDLLKSIPYLRYVLNESLRLRSPIHWSQRTCCKDCILPTGGGSDGKAPILVKKGQAVTVNVHALHRDKKVWGEDAEGFRPERWETERPTWEYLPFLGGPRICPAQQMALAECSYILVRLLQEYKAIENRDPEPWAEEIRLQSESRHGVKIGLIPAVKGE